MQIEEITKRLTEKTLKIIQTLQEYKPIFKLISSMESDVIDSCNKIIKPFINLQKNELAKIKCEEEITLVRASLQ